MSKVSELNKLAQKITGQNPKENTIREILDEISTFFKGSKVKSSNTEKAIKNVTENYSGGGSGYPPDWSEIGYTDTPQSVIYDFNCSKEIYDNWDSSSTSIDLRSYTNLVYFPFIDTSNVTSMGAMCRNLKMLRNVPLINTENVTSISQAFDSCTELTFVPILDTRSIISYGLLSAFEGDPALSDESLNNIMRMCINATGVGSAYKNLKSVGLSSAQVTRCQSLSNYQDLLDAGWTTGY